MTSFEQYLQRAEDEIARLHDEQAKAVAAERERCAAKCAALAKQCEELLAKVVAAERERCKAEIEMLRAALLPLAEAAEASLWACSGGHNPRCISVGDAIRAREALNRSKGRKMNTLERQP
jgi:hypothetical protein